MPEYTQQETRLANEIAATLNDKDAITLYLQYSRKYKEEFLRKLLNRVMAIDSSKIKRSRGALFTFLVNQSENNGGAGS